MINTTARPTSTRYSAGLSLVELLVATLITLIGLLVITQEKSWKVKRIRNTPRVTIAKCDARGNVKGEAVEATATVLDKSRTGDAYDAIARRYGLVGKVFNFFSKRRGGLTNNVALQLTAA